VIVTIEIKEWREKNKGKEELIKIQTETANMNFIVLLSVQFHVRFTVLILVDFTKLFWI